MPVPVIRNKSILTPTSGFLGPGFTHTINVYSGCAFAQAVCGTYCYAQHNNWITQGRPWGLYGVKEAVATAYEHEYDRLKRPRRGRARPLRTYMSSSTDPYIPQERSLGLTRALLEAMLDRPPDGIVIQTHTTLIIRDLDVIRQLSKQSAVWVSLTVETDIESLPGFPRHASSPSKRLATLRRFREEGISTQATVSPLLPLADIREFAAALEQVADRVILDHYLLGDGTSGLRTKRTKFPALLAANGFSEWNSLDKFWDVAAQFQEILGQDRLLISQAGFNAV